MLFLLKVIYCTTYLITQPVALLDGLAKNEPCPLQPCENQMLEKTPGIIKHKHK